MFEYLQYMFEYLQYMFEYLQYMFEYLQYSFENLQYLFFIYLLTKVYVYCFHLPMFFHQFPKVHVLYIQNCYRMLLYTRKPLYLRSSAVS